MWMFASQHQIFKKGFGISHNIIKSHITYFKEPLCSSMELKCVEQIHVDTSSCLNPCSGLFVTSFSKLEASRKNFMSAAKRHDYAQYKKITPHPAGYDGNNIYIGSIVLIIYHKPTI